jgi:hypothetical protein
LEFKRLSTGAASSLFDGVAFDPFALQEDGLASAEVDIGRGEVL